VSHDPLSQPRRVRITSQHHSEARDIAAELAAIARSGRVLSGSLTERLTRCGKSNCSCHKDPPRLHGPYWQWTRKVSSKSIGRWMSVEQHDDLAPWIENHRRMKELVTRLEELGARAVDSDPRWQRKRPIK
jgi:hypothetical protein